FSITSMISDRLRPGAPVSWQGHEFNLLRVILRSADFADIQVTGGRLLFSLARFPGGWTSFDGMHVSGGEVWFGGAEFGDGRVTFDNAEFTGGEVDLSRVGSDDYTRPPVFDPWETPPPGLLLPGT